MVNHASLSPACVPHHVHVSDRAGLVYWDGRVLAGSSLLLGIARLGRRAPSRAGELETSHSGHFLVFWIFGFL